MAISSLVLLWDGQNEGGLDKVLILLFFASCLDVFRKTYLEELNKDGKIWPMATDDKLTQKLRYSRVEKKYIIFIFKN